MNNNIIQYAFGIPNIFYVWRGSWNDPLINYKNYLFNYWDFEDMAWSMYLDTTKHPNDNDFKKWVLKHGRVLKNVLDDWIRERSYKSLI